MLRKLSQMFSAVVAAAAILACGGGGSYYSEDSGGGGGSSSSGDSYVPCRCVRCSQCDGYGRVNNDFCGNCAGRGRDSSACSRQGHQY